MLVVRLDCPLCGVRVSAGEPPAPGRCPGCGARYEGGAERPVAAALAALVAHGIDGDPERLARALFERDAEDGIAITSDHREGFYEWWVFVADGDAALRQLAHRAR